MSKPWTDAETVELKRLHAEGLPLNQISKRMGRAKETIGRRSANLGLSYDRSGMEAAIQAAIFDRKAARAKIIEDLYKRAQFNVDRLNQPEFDTLIKCGPGEEMPGKLAFVPAVDEKNLIAAVGIILTSAAKLETIDQDGGLTEARGLLGTFFAAVAAAAEPEPGVEK